MFKIISALNLNIYHIFCYFYTFNKKWASQEDENTNKGTNICNSIRYVPVWKQYLLPIWVLAYWFPSLSCCLLHFAFDSMRIWQVWLQGLCQPPGYSFQQVPSTFSPQLSDKHLSLLCMLWYVWAYSVRCAHVKSNK